jgi:nitronate monooxygenase
MSFQNELTELLGIDNPIIQAPMGGESTVQMASAVSNAGGLGGLGCSFMSLTEIRNSVAEIRSTTDRSFNLNFFAHPNPKEDAAVIESTELKLRPFYNQLGIDQVPNSDDIACDKFTEERLDLLLELQPKVVSISFLL